MTKKDYKLIAGAIRKAKENAIGKKTTLPSKIIIQIEIELARAFEEENNAFNRGKFFEACELEEKGLI